MASQTPSVEKPEEAKTEEKAKAEAEGLEDFQETLKEVMQDEGAAKEAI